MRSSVKVALLCLAGVLVNVSAFPGQPPLLGDNIPTPHMSIDEHGVAWSHSVLPPSGACVTKGLGACNKPLAPLSLFPRGEFVPRAATTTSGYVVVVTGGVPIGYMQTQLTQFGTFTYTADVTQAQLFTRPTTSKGVFEIKTTSLQWPFLGAAEGFAAWPPGNPNPAPVYGSFSPVSESVAPASDFNNPSGQPSESNLWTINLSTGELTSRWGLNSGKYVPMQLFFDVTYGDLNMAQNLTAYTSYFGDVIEPIQLYFYTPPA